MADRKATPCATKFGKIGWMTIVIAALWAKSAWAGSVVRLEVEDNGRLVAPVGLNGKGSYPFLVDTGATTTVLSEKLAEVLGVTSRGSARVHTFAGQVSVPI